MRNLLVLLSLKNTCQNLSQFIRLILKILQVLRHFAPMINKTESRTVIRA